MATKTPQAENPEALSREIYEYENYLVGHKGWEWPDILCELQDLIKGREDTKTLQAWHRILKHYARKNDYDIWRAKEALKKPRA